MFSIFNALGLIIFAALAVSLFLRYQHDTPKVSLHIFIYTALLFLVFLVVILLPQHHYKMIGIERAFLIKVYYFLELASMVASYYLVLNYLDVKKLNLRANQAILSGAIFIGLALLILGTFNQTPSPGSRPLNPRDLLSNAYYLDIIIYSRIIMLLLVVGQIRLLYDIYVSSKGSLKQVKSVSALTIGFIYIASCFVSTLTTGPLIIALKGPLYCILILLIIEWKPREIESPSHINLAERGTRREFRELFRDYANDIISHKHFINSVEKILVNYKLSEAASNNESEKSYLPLAAKSMGMSVGTVYALLKKHQINHTAKRND